MVANYQDVIRNFQGWLNDLSGICEVTWVGEYQDADQHSARVRLSHNNCLLQIVAVSNRDCSGVLVCSTPTNQLLYSGPLEIETWNAIISNILTGSFHSDSVGAFSFLEDDDGEL